MSHILVIFQVFGGPDQLGKAYSALGELGMQVAVNGVFLPPNTMVGQWMPPDTTIEQLRDTMIHALASVGVTPQSLLVAVFDTAAWWGRPVHTT